MNTKLLLAASSVVLGVTGSAFLFAPAELLTALKVSPVAPLPVLIQLMGALYLGFGMTNWMAKGSLIGGIYARPLTIGNCVHFIVGTLTLFKGQLAAGFQAPLTVAGLIYAIFAFAFVWLLLGPGAAGQAGSRH